jgi:hypothetical protein
VEESAAETSEVVWECEGMKSLRKTAGNGG